MIEKIKEKWDEILLHIKEEHELTDVSFKTWLLPTQPYSMKDGTLQILVPDVQFLGYIKKKLRTFDPDYHRRTNRNRV